MALPIEDYALSATAHRPWSARDGRIDWLCLPRFDSPACSPRCSATDEHGHWLLGPAGETRSTPALRGRHRRAGDPCATDDRVRRGRRPDAARRPARRPGAPGRRHQGQRADGARWVVRLDYGEVRPWVRRRGRRGEELIVAIAGPDKLVLRGPGCRRRSTAAPRRFESQEGDVADLLDHVVPVALAMPPAARVDERIEGTIRRRSLGRRVRVRRPGTRRRCAVAARAARAHPRATPAASSRPRRRACPRTSAASATGTTATAGCGTPR